MSVSKPKSVTIASFVDQFKLVFQLNPSESLLLNQSYPNPCWRIQVEQNGAPSALGVGLAEITRLLDVTSISSKNIEDWEKPGTLVFMNRQLVKGMQINMLDEYYYTFECELDYCLGLLFQ